MRSKHSSIWFFDGGSAASWLPAARRREERGEEPAAAARREVEVTASGQRSAEGRSCGLPSVTDWQVQEMSGYEAGRRLSAIDLLLPLPLMQSGVLRIWASVSEYGSDTLTIQLQGTGKKGENRQMLLMALIASPGELAGGMRVDGGLAGGGG